MTMKKIVQSHAGKWCIKCETVCHLFEQGLTCGCGHPWECEVLYEDDYPDKWIDATVIVLVEE